MDEIDNPDESDNPFNLCGLLNDVPTTHAGEIANEIEETTKYGGTFGNIRISGHVLLNQCGTLLTRKKYQIKGSSRHRFFLQKMCATSPSTCIPLMYPEGTLFPSIHWKMAHDNCSIVGCLPASLLTENKFNPRFASLQSHVRTRLTNPSSATSTDSRYCAHCYDMLTNISANHEDTRLILNRGLTVGDDRSGGLCVRGQKDHSLLASVDNKQMVRNLCFSGKYIPWTHFLTFTCNQKNHFGTKPIKNWIDSEDWKSHYPNFYDLESDQQQEISHAVLESSAGTMLRVWEEVFLLFIDYLRKSKSSPFKRFKSIFARKEYQAMVGNLSHSHLIAHLDYMAMTQEERDFVDHLVRASIMDIVHTSEIDKFIEHGIFTDAEDIHQVYENARKFCSHTCDDRCLVKNTDGSFRCRKLNNVKESEDNTKHTFKPLPNDYSVPCLRILEDIGLTSKLTIDEDGNVLEFQCDLAYFHPVRHIPPTNPSDDMNISPVEGYTFAVLGGMMNIQVLTGSGGCAKYVCKYIAGMDEQNYVVIEVDGTGKLVTKAIFLHNTKIASSKIAEDKERLKDKNKPQGRCISHMEMLHVILKYPEVITNLQFIKVCTMPLELRGGIMLDSTKIIEDGAYVTTAIDQYRKNVFTVKWRHHTPSQILITNDLKLSKLSVDKITQFGLRPPEFIQLFNKVSDYFRWFHVGKKVKVDEFPDKLKNSLLETIRIDALQRQIRLRKKILPEIMAWCEKVAGETRINYFLIDGSQTNYVTMMINLFQNIDIILECEPDEDIDSVEHHFWHHVHDNLLHDDDEKDHLPKPIVPYIAPTMNTSFLLHIMLSMGRFETEIDLLLHPTIMDCFRYCDLIGENDDRTSLTSYVNNLTCQFIEDQFQFPPNSKRVVDFGIITALASTRNQKTAASNIAIVTFKRVCAQHQFCYHLQDSCK